MGSEMTSMSLEVCRCGCQNSNRFCRLTFENVAHIACQCYGSTGAICAYFQADGASGTLQNATHSAAALQKHNCISCGSVTTLGDNGDSAGGLAVGFVGTSDCCAGQGDNYLICPRSKLATSSWSAPAPDSLPQVDLRAPPSPALPPFPLDYPPTLTKRSLSTAPGGGGGGGGVSPCDLDGTYPDPPAPTGKTSLDGEITFSAES